MSAIRLNTHSIPALPQLTNYRHQILKKLEAVEARIRSVRTQIGRKKFEAQVLFLQNKLFDCDTLILQIRQSQMTEKSRALKETNVLKECVKKIESSPEIVAALSEKPLEVSIQSEKQEEISHAEPIIFLPEEPLEKIELPQQNTWGTGWLAIAALTAVTGAFFFFNSRTKVVPAMTGAGQENILKIGGAVFNEGIKMSESDLREIYNKSHDLIRYYLKQGRDLGWQVRHNKITEVLKQFIIDKKLMKKHW